MNSVIAPPVSSADAVEERGVVDLLIFFARHKRLVVLLPFVAACAALGISFLFPKQYTAEVRILTPQRTEGATSAAALAAAAAGGLGSFGGAAGLLRNPSEVYVGILKSRRIADGVIEREGLKHYYDEETLHDARKTLADASKIAAGRDTLIHILVEDVDPIKAAAIANAYISELQAVSRVLALTEAGQRRQFYEGRIEKARQDLVDAEGQLKRLQEGMGAVRPDEQGRMLVEALARLRAQIAAREVQLSVMRGFSTEQNVELRQVRTEIDALRSQVAALERQQPDARLPLGKIPEAAIEYLRALREFKFAEGVFELLQRQLELSRIDEAREGLLVQVIDQAVPAEKKSSPKRLLWAIVGAVLGLTVGLILALVASARDRLRADPAQSDKLQALRRAVRTW